ncbi:hypothetical protein [Cobetia sp. MC34]|uniref:hypothetical protein n=1 Tax=Cobetia sp. MC34 TaxID=2785080 RepID=UPI001BC92197|nr:hypothetical protein [Cobetia sp. MC34]MBS4153204.1 hypothetical protein [Cobetia sp. MC34]
MIQGKRERSGRSVAYKSASRWPGWRWVLHMHVFVGAHLVTVRHLMAGSPSSFLHLTP